MTLRYPEYASFLYDALRPDPFYRTLENTCPDPSTAREAMLRYFDLSICEGAEWGRLGEAKNGKYGVSVWSVPLPPEQEARKAAAKKQALTEVLGPECATCFERIETSMAAHEAGLGLGDMWYLSILGVCPSKQGQGLGGSLLAPVLQEADAAQVPSYLTTFTPRNIPFYERHGYVQFGTFPETLTESAFTVLVRQPEASA